MSSNISIIEQVKNISNDINEKLLEVREGSYAQTFLLIKKKIIDDSLQKIINEAQINKYEYELYSLSEKCESLRYKIKMKKHRPTDDDEDMKAYKEVKDEMNWIRRTKLDGVKLTTIPLKPTDDEDMKAYKKVKDEMNWIIQTKLDGVKLTTIPLKPTEPQLYK